MSARKLQVEIDRTMKKINEGIIEFESLMSKVRSASTTNQKDKLEADLKRDIKKLQRLREQVKGWISGTEVKDKAPLQDARKRIEIQMEAFKAYEREAKTKAFSKEGLQRQREKEIRGEEGGDISEWLQDRIEELKRQIEVIEGEIESESGKKSKKPSPVENSAGRLERHNFHLDGLEKLLRMWENDAIERDLVEGVRDDIDYYVDNNQDDDFMENETIYDDLGLDEWDPEGLEHDYGDYEPGEDELGPDDNLSDGGSSIRSSYDDDDEDSLEDSDLASSSSISGSVASSLGNSSHHTPHNMGYASSSLEEGSKTASSSSTSRGASSSHATSSSASDAHANDSASTKRGSEAAIGTRTTANAAISNSSAVAAPNVLPALSMLDPTPAEAARGIRSSSHHTPAEPMHGNAPFSLGASGGLVPTGSAALGAILTAHPNGPSVIGSIVGSGSVTNGSTVHLSGVAPGSAPLSSHHATGVSLASGTTIPANTTASITSTPLSTSGQLPMVSSALNASGTLNVGSGFSTGLTSSGALVNSQTIGTSTVGGGISVVDSIGSVLGAGGVGQSSAATLMTSGGVSASLAASGAASGGLAGVTSITSATIGIPRFAPSMQRPESEMMEMAGLKASARFLPEPEPTRPPYKPRTPSSTPSSYPSIPAQNLLEDPSTFQKFPPDLLFFLFYFQQNTYQQYLAARELKRQSWRYHTKYLTWFQRHEDPKTISDTFEQGTYVYFDYETGWCQRKKSEFTFQYVFLEDNELP